MEASAVQAPSGLARTRISIGAPLLRLRSDEQLVALFRAGHDEAFRAIHDRYRQRLFAYTRQMLPGSGQDAEDALQDIFVRAYSGLRANDRELALRAWLYRVAHNRCVDELRRPVPPPPEVLELVRGPVHDPTAAAEQRESLRRLIEDMRRLPDQQRSALLMRELGGMTYADVAAALGVTVPAVKSLLVRARVGLGQAAEARNTACSEIREELIVAHDRGVRPNSMARRHLRDCEGCREFRGEVRGVSRQLAALAPTVGPLGLLAKIGLGGGASGGAAAGGGAAVTGSTAGSGAGAASVGALATGTGHVATLLAAAVVATGGAVEIQHTITSSPAHHRTRPHPGVVAHGSRASRPVARKRASLRPAPSHAALAHPRKPASSVQTGTSGSKASHAMHGPLALSGGVSMTGTGAGSSAGSASAKSLTKGIPSASTGSAGAACTIGVVAAGGAAGSPMIARGAGASATADASTGGAGGDTASPPTGSAATVGTAKTGGSALSGGSALTGGTAASTTSAPSGTGATGNDAGNCAASSASASSPGPAGNSTTSAPTASSAPEPARIGATSEDSAAPSTPSNRAMTLTTNGSGAAPSGSGPAGGSVGSSSGDS